MKDLSIFQHKMLETTRGIARPHRRCIGVLTPQGQDSDPCAITELNHLVLAFFPHPCAKTPIRAKTLMLTVCLLEHSRRTFSNKFL